MRVLVLSVTAGYGHISTAKAVAAEFAARGADVIVEDLYERISHLTYELIDAGYLFTVKHFQMGFKHGYAQMENSETMRKIAGFFTSNALISSRVFKFMKEYNPDCIISTHPFAGQVLNRLKVNGELTVPCIGVITDYCIHPGWEDCGALEYIVTASELLNYTALKKNIPQKQLAPLGIPVRPIFRNSIDKAEARRTLGLDENKRTLLVMGGSMGHGNMLNIVSAIDRLDMNLQIVCICGRNDKQRKHLTYLKTRSPIVVKGFVNNVDMYMDAADCIISKPGGLTVTESLTKKLPMILVNPIPGHEEHNVDFLLNNGAALHVTKKFSVSEAVYYLFSNPERINLMRKSIELIAKPNATVDICDLAESLCEAK